MPIMIDRDYTFFTARTHPAKHRNPGMASLGRLLQIVGLVAPPLSIILQLQGAITLGQMLIMLVAAVSAFWIGRIIEGYAKR